MKRIAAVALIAAATFVPSISMLAQDHLEKATVPFAFNVGRATMPAGTYRITSSLSTPGVISINSWEKNAHVLSLARPGEQLRHSTNALVFHCYGDQYFLSDIRSSDSSLNVHFATTKAENRAKAESLQARVPQADPILIALR